MSKVSPVNSDGKMEISHLQLKIHLHSLSIFQLPILESCIFCIQSVTEQPFYSASYKAFRHNKPISISQKHLKPHRTPGFKAAYNALLGEWCVEPCKTWKRNMVEIQGKDEDLKTKLVGG